MSLRDRMSAGSQPFILPAAGVSCGKEGDAVKPLRMLATRVGSWWKSFRAVRLRPHLSTLVLLIPVLAVLVLANVPGWRVAYMAPLVRVSFRPEIDANYEHGWPLTYLRRKTWVRELSEPARVTFAMGSSARDHRFSWDCLGGECRGGHRHPHPRGSSHRGPQTKATVLLPVPFA